MRFDVADERLANVEIENDDRSVSLCSLSTLVCTYTCFITKLTEKDKEEEEESLGNKIEQTHTHREREKR